MLDKETIKKIENFVFSSPRSINDIATHINKNWRTADRYVEEIKEEFGTIQTKVFRQGTKGALKIVYQANVDKISSSVFQEQLEKNIINSKKKEDFSPFDIFQHIPDKNKQARVEEAISEESTNLTAISELLKNTKKQLLIFSGNLSFINLKDKKNNLFQIIEDLYKKGVRIKIISRIDIPGKTNIEKMLSLNYKYGKELIEIRHAQNSLRVIIFDDNIMSLKEISEPTNRKNELNKRKYIFYEIKDKEWISWLSKIFYRIFNSSIDANKRLEEINKIKF
ncbi:MAG: hypothetical protein ACP5OG_03835 [Candidatus Nanoarchaeia archaeon]